MRKIIVSFYTNGQPARTSVRPQNGRVIRVSLKGFETARVEVITPPTWSEKMGVPAMMEYLFGA